MTTKNVFILIAIFLVIIIGNSCQKDTGIIGLDLQNPENIIQYNVDSSASVKTYSIRADSLLRAYPSLALLGSIDDPAIGTMSSYFISQMRPSENNPNLDGLTFDSVALRIIPSKYFGDINSFIKIELFEITDNIQDRDSILPSELNINNYLLNPINAEEVIIDLNTIQFDTTVVSIPINMETANKILYPADTTFEGIVSTDSIFYEYFNGILIKATPLERTRSMIGFGLSTSNSLNFYFSSIDTVIIDTVNNTTAIDTVIKVYPFYFYGATYLNYFSHTYGSDIYFDDSTRNDSITYVQTLSGLNTVINLEELKSWRDSSNVVINRALLYIKFDTLDITLINPVPQMIVYEHPGEISYSVIPDYYTSSAEYLSYNPITAQYVIKLTRHLQNYIMGNTDALSIRLFPSENYSSVRNSVIYGGSHTYKPKLYISYSKF